MSKETIKPAKYLSGAVELPGDKSISHRYAMLAALAEGTSELRHFSAAADCHSTLNCALNGMDFELPAAKFFGTALLRPKAGGMRRNAAIALANTRRAAER